MRAIGYARVSTTKQDLARQRCKITNFCGENGYELEFIIEDFGISGATLDRKGYQRLNSLTASDCDVIVVSEISRLSRKEQITEALNDIQQILNNGISVILLDDSAKVYKANENLNISELLLLIIQLWGAAQERNEIKRKNQDGKQALFKSNPYAVVDAKIPFGFRSVPNTMSNRPKYLLEQNPEEVDVVKKIFELVLDGKTLYGVMQYLNDRNIMIRKGMPSLPILSRIIHNELYIGIRKRTQSYGKVKGKEDVAIQHIEPIISEEDFRRAGEKIQTNNKYVATGKVYFNPFKGIIRCRCGRAMMIKEKKPEQGVSKLTYRCSCNESRNSSKFCSVNIDEISYELTNSVIKSLFIQRSQEITDYFKETGQTRVNELNEIIDGIAKKIDIANLRKEELNNRTKQNVQKLLVTTNEVFVKALEQDQAKTDADIKKVDAEIAGLRRKEREILNQIDSIKRAYSNIDAYERISNISNDELTEMYHLYLEKIEYYPITTMKGFYKVLFKSGMIFYIAITKVRCSPAAYIVDADVNLETGDMTFKYDLATADGTFSFSSTQVKTINVKDFFMSEWTEYAFAVKLNLDLSYRERYAKQLAEKKSS